MGFLSRVINKLGGAGLVGAVGGTALKLGSGILAANKNNQSIKMFNNTLSKYAQRQEADQAHTDAVVNEDAASNVNTMAAVNAANNIAEQSSEQNRSLRALGATNAEAAAMDKSKNAVGQILNSAAVQNQTRQDNAYQQGQQNWMNYQKAADALQTQIAKINSQSAKDLTKQGDNAAHGFAEFVNKVSV